MKNALREAHVFESTYPVGQPYVMERRIKHYSSSHQILLVGEGDFSFSSALANAFGSAHNMVATSLDSRGFCGKESDRAVIKKHRHLVKMFLKNARTMLSSTGEIHVAHKEKHPYDKWKLVKQAEKFGLVLKESVNFYLADYPGYTNRRGDGFYSADTFFLGPCKTYKFILGPLVFDPSHLLPIKPRHRTWGASNFDRVGIFSSKISFTRKEIFEEGDFSWDEGPEIFEESPKWGSWDESPEIFEESPKWVEDEEIFEESDFFLERGAWGTVLWIV